MLINECYIDGFGCFKDRNFTIGNSKAVLIIGSNEAGKTTLFSFLRGQLSGYHAFKRKENHYLPLNGGKHGGRFSVLYKNEEFQISRYVKEKDFTITPETSKVRELRELLESIQIEDYRALFAFDLDELKVIGLLEKEDLTERLFSTGLTGANNIISEGIEELKDLASILYKPRASSKLQDSYSYHLAESEKLAAAEAELIEFESQGLIIEGTKVKLEEIRSRKILIEVSLVNIEKEKVKFDLLTRFSEISSELSQFTKRVYPSGADINQENHLFLKGSEFSLRFKELKEKLIPINILSKKLVSSKELITKFIDFEQNTASKESLLNKLSLVGYDPDYLRLFYLLLIVIVIFATSDYLALSSLSLVLLSFGYFSYRIHTKYKLLNEEINKHDKVELNLINHISNLKLDFENQELNNSMNVADYLLKLEKLGERNSIHNEEIRRIERESETLSLELKALYAKYEVLNHIQFLDLLLEKANYEKVKNEHDEFLRIALTQGFDLTNELSKENGLSSIFLNKRENILIELKSIKIEEDFLLKEIARYSVKFESLTQSHEIEELRQSVENSLEICNELYSQWQVAVIAEKALKVGMNEMYSSRYSEVLRLASSNLESMTLSDYKKISLGVDAAQLLVTSANGRLCQLETLSRGTLEQVYLAMRLALSNLYGKKYGELPLLFDDILVNFDDRRARATMHVLKDISTRHQVLLFTCHEWVKALFTEVMGSDGQVVSI